MGNFFSRSTSGISDALFGLYGANVDKQLQLFAGTYEVEECQVGEGEADLLKKGLNCKKNPGHEGFIPINKFSIENLPAGCPKEVFDLTKALGDITVRIAVNFTSLYRPEFSRVDKFISESDSLNRSNRLPETNSQKKPIILQDEKINYPHYNKRGTNALRLGTGRVWRVTRYTQDMEERLGPYRSCPCPICVNLGTPSKVWWNVVVATATHVVFDESEAKMSTCRLWFDDVKSPMIEMYGCWLNMSDHTSDWCLLSCATHDPIVGESLEEMVRQFDGHCLSLEEQYKGRKDVDKLTIIVSHPHGCSKQVSIGQWVDRAFVIDECAQLANLHLGNTWTRYTYTTQTCSGSSGALVYRLGCKWLCNHRHSGTHNGLNYSGVNVN